MYSVDIKQGYAGVSVSFAARALRVSGSHKGDNNLERKKNHIEFQEMNWNQTEVNMDYHDLR